MKNVVRKSVMLVLTALILAPTASHADIKRLCRGGDLPSYRLEIKKAVKAKLDAAHIVYKRVTVEFTNIKRPKDVLVVDFSSDIQVSSETIPTVTFTGSFPATTSCDITGNVKIRVVYPNGSSVTKSAITIPGTLLYAASLKSDGGLGGSPNAD